MAYRDFLSIEQRLELQSALRQVRGFALPLRRANILLLLDDGYSFVEIARLFYLEPSTIETLFKAYQAHGIDCLDAAPILGRPFKLDEAQRASLEAHLENANYSTSKEIRAHIKAEYGVDYEHSSILSLLKKLGFVHKTTILTTPAVDEDIQKAAIEAYEALKNDLPDDEAIVFLDAVHPTHMAKTGKVWMKKTDNRHVLSSTGRKRINIHGALNVATGQFNFMNNATVDAYSTVQLLQKLETAYSDKKKIHVYLDNAAYHYSKPVKAWLERHDNRIILRFLPAYCPHLNSIERLWHVLHNHTTRNKYYKTYGEFCNAIMLFCRETIPQIWEEIKSTVTDNFSVKSNKNLKLV
jgi:transposase